MCTRYLQSRQDDIRGKYLSADVIWQIQDGKIPIMSADSKMSVKSSGLSGSSCKNIVTILVRENIHNKMGLCPKLWVGGGQQS